MTTINNASNLISNSTIIVGKHKVSWHAITKVPYPIKTKRVWLSSLFPTSRTHFPVFFSGGYAYLHKSFGSLKHTVFNNAVFQPLLYFCHIYHLSLCQFFRLSIVNVNTVYGYLSPLFSVKSFSMKESFVAAEVKQTSECTPSFTWITVWIFILHVWGWRPTTLNRR